MERLCISSFAEHGHKFHLWVYEPIKNIPKYVEVKDASTIISEPWQYKCGPHTGSYGGFSDLFRYKLLYDHGGWWVDMDIQCLHPFEFETPYVFRRHSIGIVGNIMCVLPKSDLMKRCLLESLDKVTPENTDWELPIRILNSHAADLGLLNYITDKFCPYENLIWSDTSRTPPDGVWAIHYCNELIRRNPHIDKWNPRSDSFYAKELKRYEIIE